MSLCTRHSTHRDFITECWCPRIQCVKPAARNLGEQRRSSLRAAVAAVRRSAPAIACEYTLYICADAL